MLKNLVQIITGCGCSETIYEASYWTLTNNGIVIVVDALWPTLNYPEPGIPPILTQDRIASNERFEDLKSLIDKHSLFDRFFFIKPDRFMYNGTQYNLAIDFIAEKKIPCDHILFFDGDEAIDPIYSDALFNHIELAKSREYCQLRFMSTIEILPGWKALKVNDRAGGNFGFLWGDGLLARRMDHFDGNFLFDRNVPFMITQVPLYHLHHFRKNAARRISEDGSTFYSGGLKYDIRNADDLPFTPYTIRLRQIYGNLFPLSSQGAGYLGSLTGSLD